MALSKYPQNKSGSWKRRQSLRRFRTRLSLEQMEERIALVVGAFAVPAPVATGVGFDGVVQLTSTTGGCTGTLLPTGQHVLTAAHCVTDLAGNIDTPSTTVSFNLTGNTIQMTVPQADYRLYQPWNGNVASGNDLAILLLPQLAPSGPGGLGAERFNIFRGNNEVGQNFTIVGYGRTGTGNTGDTIAGGTKLQGQNRFDGLGQVAGGPTDTTLAYDFDNGISANDAIGGNLGLGAAEANAAPGDSGGPCFISGQIAGVTSYRQGFSGLPDLLPGNNSSFGDLSVTTRVSSYAWWIDYITGGRHDLNFDMEKQVVGRDANPDTIDVRRNGEFLDVFVNGQHYHRDRWRDVGRFNFYGSSAADTITVPADLSLDFNGIVDGRGGSDRLVINSRNNSRTYTVTSTYVDITGAPTTQLPYRNLEGLTIGAGSTDTVNVWSTAAATPVTIVEAGTVNIGPQGNLADIRGEVTVRNPPAYTALTINNSADTIPRSNVVLLADGVTGLAGAAINWVQNDLRSLTIRGGSHASTYFVLNTPISGVAGGLTTNLICGTAIDQVHVRGTTGGLSVEGSAGADTVNVADPMFGLQNIRGTVAVANAGGQSVLNINDSLNAGGRTATAMFPGAGWSTIRGLSPADITHRLSQTGNINITLGGGSDTFTFENTDTAGLNLTTLNTGGGVDTINVRAVTGPLTINGGTEDDTVNVQAAAFGLGLQNTLTFNGQEGSDTLNFNDQTIISAIEYSIFTSRVKRVAWDIPISSLERINIRAGSGNDDFVLFSQDPGQQVDLFGGEGNDRFLTGALSADGVRGPVRFLGEGGADNRILINDQLDTQGIIAHIDQTSVGAAAGDTLFGAGGSLTFSSVQRLDLTCGSGIDSVLAQPNAVAVLNIDLGPQTGGFESGDMLGFALADVLNYVITPGAPGTGTVTSDNFQPIHFTDVESASIDDVAPQVVASSYVEPPFAAIQFQFSDDVSQSLTVASLELTNTNTGDIISSGLLALTYDGESNTAEFTFPGFPNGSLPFGDYAASLAPSVSDGYGNRLAATAPLYFTASGQGAIFTVNSTLDTGDGVCDLLECTLREAIDAANAAPNSDFATPDQIVFDIPGPGPFTIQPISALPQITDPVVLDGSTQTGFAGTPVIELDGSLAPDAHGLVINSGRSTVRGFAINRFVSVTGPSGGITLSGDGGNVIQGNYIGTNLTGDAAFPVGGQITYGVIVFGANGNLIGTDGDGINDESEGNVLSGQDSAGIILQVGASNNVIAGNRIGTTADGTTALGNSRFGVFFIDAGTGNRIGTNSDGVSDSAERNLISGNPEAGIRIDSDANVVAGNFIGTDVSGTAAIANGAGIRIDTGSGNQIGGSDPLSGNTIAFNTLEGVSIDGGTGNNIQGNSIFLNSGLGVNLIDAADPSDGVTPNDVGDQDLGSNNLRNFAVVSSAIEEAGVTTVVGTIDGEADATLRVELFANDACDDSGYGEGQVFLGAITVTTDANGLADLFVPVSSGIVAGQFLTTTVTDTDGNTSEFSACVAVTIDTVIRWTSEVDGLWNDPTNWENGHIPGPGDTAIIDVLTTDVVVTIPAGQFTIASLISHESLIIADAEFVIGGTSEVSALQLMNGGMLRIESGELQMGVGSSGGTMDILEGASIQFLAGFNLEHGARITGNGLAQVASTDSVRVLGDVEASHLQVVSLGMLDVQGLITLSSPLSVDPGGILIGEGRIAGSVVNGGLLRPGDSPGILTIDGDYTQTADATLILEIGGIAPTEYDQLHVSGMASFDGSLSVVLINGFTPGPGAFLPVISHSSFVGGFSSISGSAVTQYNPTNVTLYPTTSPTMDFNLDGVLDGVDIDDLVDRIATFTHDPRFDLSGDGLVDHADRDVWLAVAGAVNLSSGNPYRLGDANLDGVVDGSDFGIWNANKFTEIARWTKGDFNTDGVVDGSDFGIWNGNKFTASDGRRSAFATAANRTFSNDRRIAERAKAVDSLFANLDPWSGA